LETPADTAPSEQVVEVADLPVIAEDEVLPSGAPRSRAAQVETLDPVPSAEPERWQGLAETGKYSQALDLVEAAGFEALLATSGPNDLLLLANTARYARSGQRAKQAYTTIRGRFAGTHAARLSAYYLARLAGDVERQPKSEASWLRTYLSESPSGELSASARARLMELFRSLGDPQGARAMASDYLRLHPNGPHADVARSLLGQ
jgi:hypothetical protein